MRISCVKFTCKFSLSNRTCLVSLRSPYRTKIHPLGKIHCISGLVLLVARQQRRSAHHIALRMPHTLVLKHQNRIQFNEHERDHPLDEIASPGFYSMSAPRLGYLLSAVPHAGVAGCPFHRAFAKIRGVQGRGNCCFCCEITIRTRKITATKPFAP